MIAPRGLINPNLRPALFPECFAGGGNIIGRMGQTIAIVGGSGTWLRPLLLTTTRFW
jgi:hypothetical protein